VWEVKDGIRVEKIIPPKPDEDEDEEEEEEIDVNHQSSDVE
jgi:heat shock protein 1/8